MVEAVAFPKPNLMAVPESLRRLAEQIDSGIVEKMERAIVITVDELGEIHLFGYGEVKGRSAEIGLLFMAAMQMAAE